MTPTNRFGGKGVSMNEKMMTAETFEEFLNSFFYGSRTDLNFKFLKELGPEAAGPFFQELFSVIANAIDSGDWQPVEQTVFQWQVQNYAEIHGFEYDDGPFTQLTKPVDKATVGLLTSSGHFVDGDAPAILGVENIPQDEVVSRIMELVKAAPILSSIPTDTPLEKLRIRHGGYDITPALQDSGVTFPLAAVKALATQNTIGNLYPTAWSFIGACSQSRMIKHEGPAWVEEMVGNGVEALLLVPV